MFVYTATLVCLLAVLVCSSKGNLCKPLFIQQPLTTFSCDPYQHQHAPNLVCSVSDIASSTHKLAWYTTAQSKDDAITAVSTAVQVHRQRNDCYFMSNTLQLTEPLVRHVGQHWCVLSSLNGTIILQSSFFSLQLPAQYKHKPACQQPDHSQQHHHLDTRYAVENNGSGDGGQDKILTSGVIAGVVIAIVMVTVGGVILVIVLTFGCMYMRRKHSLLEDTDSIDKETSLDNNNMEESNNSNSINYISYSELESTASNTLRRNENIDEEREESNSGAYQALNTNTRDYLSVYTMLGERSRMHGDRDRIAEADSLPRTHSGSIERRKRGFPIRKPEHNTRVTVTPKEVVRNPSAHRIRHTHTALAQEDKKLVEED